MHTRIHAGMTLATREGERGEVRAVMRNGRFLVRFASRSAWFSMHEKSAFVVA